MSGLRLRLAAVWIACFALAVSSTSIVLWMLYLALTPEDRTTAMRLFDATGDLPFLIALILLGACGFIAASVVRVYFAPLRAAAEATAIARTCNLEHRLMPSGPVELRALITAINALADSHHGAIQSVEDRISAAHADLAAERNRLAVLLSELAQGVIVTNADAHVLLYNERARRMVWGSDARHRGYLGLGRPLASVLPGAATAAALESLRSRSVAGEADPSIIFHDALADGTMIRVRAAPVANAAAKEPDAARDGFVLLLEQEHGDEPSATAERAIPQAASSRPVYYDFELFRTSRISGGLDDLPLANLTYTVFDTETTGLEPAAGDEIIAIGAVRIVNRRIIPGETFDQLVDPGRAIAPASTRIHGIDAAMLRGQPRIADVLPSFQRFCGDTVLIGHNIAFDMRFLAEKEAITGIAFRQPLLDTLLLSEVLHPTIGDHRLEALAHRYGIELVARHDALGDAILTAEIFLRMLPLLAERGIVTLRAARMASEGSRYADLRY